MKKQYFKLEQVKENFKVYNKHPHIIYLYIAPKAEDLFKNFYSIVSELPTNSSSLYEILNNESTVRSILLKYFPDETELDIYIASNDTNSSIFINGTLRDYIQQEGIEFDF